MGPVHASNHHIDHSLHQQEIDQELVDQLVSMVNRAHFVILVLAYRLLVSLSAEAQQSKEVVVAELLLLDLRMHASL